MSATAAGPKGLQINETVPAPVFLLAAHGSQALSPVFLLPTSMSQTFMTDTFVQEVLHHCCQHACYLLAVCCACDAGCS